MEHIWVLGANIYVRKDAENVGCFDCLGRKKTHKNGKRVIATKVLPGTFLVILGILTHVRFLHVFVSEYLIFC